MTLGRSPLRIFCSRGTPPVYHLKPRPEPGPDWLICAEFARKRPVVEGDREGIRDSLGCEKGSYLRLIDFRITQL